MRRWTRLLGRFLSFARRVNYDSTKESYPGCNSLSIWENILTAICLTILFNELEFHIPKLQHRHIAQCLAAIETCSP